MPILKGYVSSIWVADLTLETESMEIFLTNVGGNYWGDEVYLYVLDTSKPFTVYIDNEEVDKNKYQIICRVGPILKVFTETAPSTVSIEGEFRPVSFFHETARECSLSIESATEDITTLGSIEAGGFVVNAKMLKSATMTIPGFLSYSETRDYYTIADLLNDEHEIFVQFFIGSGAESVVWIAEGVANVSIDNPVDSVATMDLDITINGMAKLIT